MTDLVIAQYADIQAIANAIRSKTGQTERMSVPQMAGNIVGISNVGSGGNVDLTGYATEQWVKDQKYLTEVPDGYAKTTDIPTKPEDIGALPDTYTPPNQTAEQVGADPKGAAASAVSQHNTADDSHNDIRLELKVINERLTAFFDSDEQTLDELSEIVAYITSNKSLIDGITINKVSVADIINDLTTNVSTKPLSAAQGVVLSGLIDTLSKKLANYQPKGDYALRSEIPTVPSKVSAFTNDAGYLTQHQDISGKVNKNGLTLGIHTDGLVYVFVDGVPVGNGIEMGVSGDVFGYVDENNNIVVQGNLPDGSYTVKYEMSDGSTVDIGNLVLDSNVYYTVTNNLTNCTSNNSATQAVSGQSYSAIITANSGYELKTVTVTMGGSPVTVSGGSIGIANVTGNIVITAVAEEIQTAPAYTNLLPLSVNTDGSDYRGTNNEDGYKVGYRLSRSASGGEVAADGMCCSGFMPASHSDYIRIKNITEYSTDGWNFVMFYDNNKTYLTNTTLLEENTSLNYNNGLYTFKPNSFEGTVNVAFIRICTGVISGDTIVTRNEEIV